MQVFRKVVQILSAMAVNSAFIFGQRRPDRIYQGHLKQFCSPGLNCYACPYALTACPIGALQNFISFSAYHFSVYIGGFLLLVGTLTGRLTCGWICPFGLYQEALHRIPTRKFKLLPAFRHIRWLMLLILVLILPYFFGKPTFCGFVCPAGALQGGVTFGVFSPQIRALTGLLYWWKIALLIFFSIGSVFIFRLFCRIACPLGLIYGFFNRISILGLNHDPQRCLDCGLCEKVCPVDLKPEKGEYLSGSCIRCLKCRDACPRGCFRFGVKFFSEKF